MSKKEPKQTYFDDNWLSFEEFKPWLKRDDGGDNTKFYCKLCKKPRELSNMGIGALQSHMKGKNHLEKLKCADEVKNFFTKHTKAGNSSTGDDGRSSVCDKESASSTAVENATNKCIDLTESSDDGNKESVKKVQVVEAKKVVSEPSKYLQSTIGQSMTTSDVLKSEIIWTFYMVSKGLSNNSAVHLNETFRKMFPDSSIASSFQLSKDKAKYLTNYGLAPYIKDILKDEVSKAPFSVIGFDESLNEVTQTSQMDLVVRYWDSLDERVKVRYWDSKFLGHTANTDLLKAFLSSIEDIDLSAVIQVSMDGPFVNWVFYDKVVDHRKDKLGIVQAMVNIGSCGLHIIHGAFKTGIEATGWNMKKTMSGSYRVLHDTPARRADYTTVTMSIEFPFSFCATRWVEDDKVADRLLHIWPNMVKIVRFWEKLPKSKQPSSKSFLNVQTASNDVLTPVKLSFFSYFAGLFKPYLKKYQTRNPMVPYMHGDLVRLFKSVLKVIIKDDVITACKSSSMLLKVDMEKKANLKSNKECTIGFTTEGLLSDLVKKDLIDNSTVQEFYDCVRQCVRAAMGKLIEKSPLGSVVVRNAVVFNPECILENSISGLEKRLKVLLQHLLSLKLISGKGVADEAYDQYSSLKSDVEVANIDVSKIERLDDFYFKQMKVSKYPQLASVIQIILTLSHGQADVERGFSVNAGVLQDNMKEDSIVSKRLVKDYLISNSLQPHTVEVSSQLRASCRHARQRYQQYLEEKKKEKEKDAAASAKEILSMEINELQEKIANIEKTIKVLDEKYVSLIRDAETSEDVLQKVVEANALKKKSDQQAGDKRKLEESLDILTIKRSKL